jgi:hypothetical protein
LVLPICQPATERFGPPYDYFYLKRGGIVMFYTPEELHRRKKIKNVVITLGVSTAGIAVAVLASMLGSL